MSQIVNRREFYRTKIGPTEKVIGGVILLLLVGIGFGIARKGHNYDQTRYTGDIEAMEFTRNAVEGKAATLRNESDLRASESLVSGDGRADRSFQEILPLGDGLLPMGETEVYSVDTLYEKINGRAPAYFEYNFQELTQPLVLTRKCRGRIPGYLPVQDGFAFECFRYFFRGTGCFEPSIGFCGRRVQQRKRILHAPGKRLCPGAGIVDRSRHHAIG